MSKLLNEPTTVPAANGQTITLNPGDTWPLPFRGSRYSLKQVEDRIRMCWTRLDVVQASKEIPQGLIRAMKQYRNDVRGRIYVTPHKEVITKRQNGDTYECVYLGKIDGVYTFPGFDLNPDSIQTGNLWRGLHFRHGEEFAVWNRAGNDDYLYWTHKGLYFRTTERYPEICAQVREIRPKCGRIYITEFGHIWMNLPDNDVSYMWAPKFKNLLQTDKQYLSTHDTLLRSIFARKSATYSFPVYLGKISDFDSGIPPRTHFNAYGYFGKGGETEDDGDVYDSESWKRMKRDQ